MRTVPFLALAALALSAPAFAQTVDPPVAEPQAGISTTGVGTATFRVAEARVLWLVATGKEQTLRQALARVGVRDRQVQTASAPANTYATLVVTDLRRLPEIWQACESVGGNLISVEFTGRSDDAERARRAAMRAAVENARKEAGIWADAAGVRLGKVIAIVPRGSGASSLRIPAYGGGPGSLTPSDVKTPETLTATATVSLRFALP